MHPKEGPSTRCVHYGRAVDPITHAMNTPIYENAAFAYEELGTWKEVALGRMAGDIYSRNSNPTVRAFNEKMAALAAVGRVCELLYLESPTNPLLRVVDLEKLFAAAHRVGAVTVTDNTFATPINQHPLALGSDLVLYR